MNPEIVSFQYATGMCLLLENVGGCVHAGRPDVVTLNICFELVVGGEACPWTLVALPGQRIRLRVIVIDPRNDPLADSESHEVAARTDTWRMWVNTFLWRTEKTQFPGSCFPR